MTSPMGTVVDLAVGAWTCSVTTVGATLRALTHHGDDVVTTFPVDGRPEHSQGAQLAPWPNRLRAGRYEWQGRTQQVEVPAGKPFAIHGLVRQAEFEVVEQADDRVVLSTLIAPQAGWPHPVRLDVAHVLDDDGLTVEVSAINVGDEPAPFGYGAHPYLVLRHPARATLEIPASRHLEVDADLLPVALAEVDGTDLDYRRPRPLGRLDTAFTGLVAGEEGSRVVLRDGDRTTTVWGDPSIGWWQVYTPGDGGSVAVEPMTCGPDAFNEGEDFGLVTLPPGSGVSLSWGISSIKSDA